MNQKTVKQIKVVLLGDSGVGKTSIAQRFILGTFEPNSPSTRIAGFMIKYISLPNLNTAAYLKIWDTAGQEKYKSMAPMYYRNAAVAVLVFDMTSMASFRSVGRWVQELREEAPNVRIVLAGNKADLMDSQEVAVEVALEFAKKAGIDFDIISAKENINVDEMFEKVASIIVKENADEKLMGNIPDCKSVLKLKSEKKPKNLGCCCYSHCPCCSYQRQV
eukprot:TRINITY_DN1321_c0_g1_i5.p1 TRINITY_DN1321_c0_g1~~TRINITY_DN1321_c0_g1_i5.p1  ORF type:complete len:219 (-),score=58.26 TRINITY_DN1321_c0_g1_i5:189-845(-)